MNLQILQILGKLLENVFCGPAPPRPPQPRRGVCPYFIPVHTGLVSVFFPPCTPPRTLKPKFVVFFSTKQLGIYWRRFLASGNSTHFASFWKILLDYLYCKIGKKIPGQCNHQVDFLERFRVAFFFWCAIFAHMQQIFLKICHIFPFLGGKISNFFKTLFFGVYFDLDLSLMNFFQQYFHFLDLLQKSVAI